jgi:quercetin dioxygenase-like cupin family protein
MILAFTERRNGMTEKKSNYLRRIEDLPLVPLTEESKSRLLLTEKVLVSFIQNPPGCVFPVHSHPSEQILVILEGEEEHICGEESFLMKAGDVCVHPANIPHGGRTRTGFRGIDIFCPPREEHVQKLKKFLESTG